MKYRILTIVMAISILLGLFGCTGKSPEPWQQLTVSRNHMDAALCFHFHISPNDAGQMILTGYCTDKDGTAYVSENGIPLSEKALNQLREMQLDTLPNRKKTIFPFAVPDKTTEKLVLVSSNGKEIQKEPSQEVMDAVLETLLPEFSREIYSFETISLRISGMRFTKEYEILNRRPAQLSCYRLIYPDREETRELEKSVPCDSETILALLKSCDVASWDGFHGSHPADILDGTMFDFVAVVNDVWTIRAEGSENFPVGYKAFVRALERLLHEF